MSEIIAAVSSPEIHLIALQEFGKTYRTASDHTHFIYTPFGIHGWNPTEWEHVCSAARGCP